MREVIDSYSQHLRMFNRALERQRDEYIDNKRKQGVWCRSEDVNDELFPAYWELELFKQSYDLTITDWINLRGDDFFDARDNIHGKMNKMKFTLTKINIYKQSR
jgi:hypothetical protein